MTFNPRLRPSDVAIVLGLLFVVTPLATVALQEVAPGLPAASWAARIGLTSGIVVLFFRGTFFQVADSRPRSVGRLRSAGSLLLMGIGGTVVVLAIGIFLVMSTEMSNLRDSLWLLLPTTFIALGASIVWLGARVRQGPSRSVPTA